MGDHRNPRWRAFALPPRSEAGNALTSGFGSLAPRPTINRIAEALSYTPPPPNAPLGGLLGLGQRYALPVAPLTAPAPAIPAVPRERMTYFAFDFDDIMRVNNVRQSGKIGPRVFGNSRGFKDRSIWEKSNAKTKNGLKQVMQKAVDWTGVVSVLIGTTTHQSFWVRYEIALSVIGQRGLVAIDLNSINHSDQSGPDPLGVNPLHFMGVCKRSNGSWYLIEKIVVETPERPDWKWVWYDQYTKSVPRPAYIPDVENTVMPLALYTDRYDFKAEGGAGNMGLWLDVAAKRAGR